jgi:hypothetical protein
MSLKAANPQDMGRLHPWMQGDVVAPAMPDIALISQEIMHLVTVTPNLAKLFDRRLDPATLGMERIKIHDDENDAVTRGSHLAVEEKRLVLNRVEPEIVVKMQGPILAPDPV